MTEVLVYKQSAYPVSSKKIKEKVKETLSKNGVVSDCQVSVALVGKAKIDELAGEPGHPVLAYANNEIREPFSFPQKDIIYLGEIVVSFQAALDDSQKSGKLLEEAVAELVEHATLHLIGIHHD
jgi:ssRNA-specific RNase YbeY (16S rRNA maturation enzyme)